MLVAIPDVLTADELAAIRGQLDQAKWAQGVSAGSQARHAKHNEQVREDDPVLHDLRIVVMRALNRSQTLLSAALPFKILPPNFNRYSGNHNHYGRHTDSSLRPLPDGSYLRTDISATLFLSSPEDYDGGELSIDDTCGCREIKLPAGHLVMYPSGFVHQVMPVTRGTRLACYLFMQSLVKDVECRRHLYQMDQSLIALRARHGETDPDLISLTGLYNNLARRWSEC